MMPADTSGKIAFRVNKNVHIASQTI